MPTSPDTSTCPSEDVLVAFASGALAAATRAGVEAHVTRCALCRAALGGADETTPTTAWSAGTHVGRFVLIEALGEGSMGTVFSAYDSALDRRVALKFLKAPPGEAWDSVRRDQTSREARALARMQHPHVLAVFDAGEHQGTPFLATEYVDGGTLREWLAGPRAPAEVERVLFEAGRGLHAAHAAGLVHRDFKPENVMVGKDGRARVADFGLAGESHSKTPLPMPRALLDSSSLATLLEAHGQVGTPAYMAPEVAKGERGSAKADQFAFCATAYEALVGRRAFPDALGPEREQAIAAGADVEKVPRRWRAVLARGLSASPSARFASMAALLEALAPSGARSRRVWLAIPVVLAAGVAAVVVVQNRAASARCEQAAGVAAQLESAELLGPVETKLSAELGPQEPGPVREVRALVHGFVERWSTLRRSTCFPTSPAEQVMARARSSCLDRKLEQVSAVLSVLGTSTRPVAGSAVRAVGTIASLEDCAREVDPETPLEPKPPEALARALDAVNANFELGDYAEAARLGRALEPQVRAQASPRFLSEALRAIARSRNATGADLEARAMNLEAYRIAEGAKAPAEAARAMLLAAAVAGIDLRAFDEAFALLDVTRATAERAGLGPEFLARIALIEGRVRLAQGDAVRAGERLEASLAFFAQAPGVPPFDVVKTRAELASAKHQAGLRRAALAIHEETMPRLMALGGQRHPLVASYSTNQGNVLLDLGRYDDALPRFERALAIQRVRLGEQHCNTIDTQVSRALARARSGALAQLPDLETWLAAELKLECPSEYVAAAQTVLAEVARREGAFERSVAVAAVLQTKMKTSPELARHGFAPGLELAHDAARRGHHDEALTLAHQACDALAPVLPETHPARVECAVETVRIAQSLGRAVPETSRAAALAGDDSELAPAEIAVREMLRKAL